MAGGTNQRGAGGAHTGMRGGAAASGGGGGGRQQRARSQRGAQPATVVEAAGDGDGRRAEDARKSVRASARRQLPAVLRPEEGWAQAASNNEKCRYFTGGP